MSTASVLAIWLLGSSIAMAQPVPKAPAKPSGLTQEQTRQAHQYIEMLSAKEFAVRERGAEGLVLIGEVVVPLLREHVNQSSNAEAKLRAQGLIKQMNDGDLQTRIEAFTRGEEVGFEGWPIFRIIFGESGKARDLFVDLIRHYPELVESFHGTSRDLAKAMETVVNSLALRQRKLPVRYTVADAVALLLPVGEEAVPITAAYERNMMRILRMAPASQTARDPVLGRGYQDLLNAWIRRSTLDNREMVIDFALQNELTAAYRLAIKTLSQSDEPRTQAIALQAIARFGRIADVRFAEPFLDDSRELQVLLHSPGKLSRVRMRDVAMATIAKLHKLPLTELGFPSSAKHPKYGFIYEDLVFTEEGDDKAPIEKQRGAAMTKIKQLVEQGKRTGQIE
ncbi:hypothetical protein [Planctomycetes bacterium K23_9]